MHTLHVFDAATLVAFFILTGAVAVYAARKQTLSSFFVGRRNYSARHIGTSVAATDVGGGFSIGLASLGFTVGISASWLLATGLIGGWLCAKVLVPRVKPLADKHGWLTYGDYLEHRFDARVRALAALAIALGCAAFVGVQLAAAARLASAVIPLDATTLTLLLAAIVIAYTALGGLHAVMLTDAVQWAVLLLGLLIALPTAWIRAGGFEGLTAALPPTHFAPFEAGVGRITLWMLTIVPAWFVTMTFYQRIYAARDVRAAQRGFILAGVLEFPVIALLGTVLGMLARALLPESQPEQALPLLLAKVLPVGIAGLVLAGYFSAVMSTADSVLSAAVNAIVNDFYRRFFKPDAEERPTLRLARWLTLGVGAVSTVLVLRFPSVLDMMMIAYAFIVSALFVPTLAGILSRRVTPKAAGFSVLLGAGCSAGALALFPSLSEGALTLVGVGASALGLLLGQLLSEAPAMPEAAKSAPEPGRG